MDGTEERKDTSQTGDTSGETKETSQEPQTLTGTQAKKMVDDALSAAGRDAKTLGQKTSEATRILEQAQKATATLEVGRAKWVEERNKQEREAAGDDIEAQKTVDVKQRQRAKDAELFAREATVKVSEDKHAEALKELVTSKKEQNALEIANRFGVDAKSLVKFTDGSPEAMEELAKALPKKEETKTLTPDSGKTIGGGTLPDSAKGKMRQGWDELHK